MWRSKLGIDISHRLCEEYIPTKLSHSLQGGSGKKGAQDSVLQQKDVPRAGSFNGTIMCGEFHLLFLFRIYQEAN